MPYDRTLHDLIQFKNTLWIALDAGIRHAVLSHQKSGNTEKLRDCRFFFTNYLRNDSGNFAQVYVNASSDVSGGYADFVKNSFVVFSILGEDELIGLGLSDKDQVSKEIKMKFESLLGFQTNEVKIKTKKSYDIIAQERIALGLNFDLLEDAGDCDVELWYKG